MMRRKRLVRYSLTSLFVLIVSYSLILQYYRTSELTPPLGHLNDYSNDTLDTYFRRIKQFLAEYNRTIFSFENQTDIDVHLSNEIDKRILQLHEQHQAELSKIHNEPIRRQGCQSSCCWFERKMPSFYHGEFNRSPMVLDRISQIDMKLLADVHYGNLRVPNGVSLSKLTKDILPCLQNNTIIFVDTPSLKHFWDRFHSKITVNYILISGDSDLSSPFPLNRFYIPLFEQIFAKKTFLVHWFAMNCRLGDLSASSTFSCLPQGVSQWFNQRYYLQLLSGKDDSVKNRFLKSNDYWLFASFSRDNGRQYRRPLWNLACYGRLKSISRCFSGGTSNDQWYYYLHLARSKFVLSPPGGGMDCYRTWEALYFGSIPIILHSSINSIYNQLPVFIVHRYEDITLSVLEQVYENFTRQTYDYTRLYKGFWQRQIHSYRTNQEEEEMIQIQYR